MSIDLLGAPVLSRRAALTAAAASPVLAAAAPAAAARAAAPPPPVTNVFVHAHQDDELLSLGPEIKAHADAGQAVAVVCATDGAATWTRSEIARRLGRDVEPWEMTVHRDDEWVESVRTLGGIPVLPPPGVRGADGDLGDAGAAAVIDWCLTTWPGVRVKTHSPLAPHRDHSALGRAALAARQAGTVRHLWLYLSGNERRILVEQGADLPDLEPLSRDTWPAQAGYRRWDPPRWWSVGYISAPVPLGLAAEDPTCYRYQA